VSATGIGLVIALASVLFDLGGASGQLGGIFASLWNSMKGAFTAIWDALAPVVHWLKTEIPILLHAVAQGFSQLIVAVVQLAKSLWSAISPVVSAIGSAFVAVARFIASSFGITANNMSELWTELVAEISVFGLRIKQVVLTIAIGFVSVGHTIMWVWQTLAALGDFVRDSFANAFTNGIQRIGNAMGVLKALVKDLAKAFWDFIKHPWRAPTFDFTETKKAMEKFNKDKDGEKHAKLNLPEFNPAGELKESLGKTTREIQVMKEKSRKDQAEARAKAGLPDDEKKKGGLGGPHIKVGSQDKATFSNPVSFWQKLMEASAREGQAKEDPGLKEQKTTNQWLEQIYKSGEDGKGKKGGGKGEGVFPR
jgi:hypothetical protein